MKVHTAVLGAGFSLVVGGLPLVDELGERVRAWVAQREPHDARLTGVFHSAPATFEQGSFERWLSRVAEAQPDLDDRDNAANQFAFQVVTSAIHEVLVEAERGTLTQVPGLLERLVTCWHALRATVVTFNYDTLLERAAAEVINRNAGSPAISTYALVNNIPPDANQIWVGKALPATMRILKLHGSLDTFWVPGDVSGTTIARLGELRWDRTTGETSDALDREGIMPGRVPFIVPPASAKSALLSNPVTRQLWRTAAARLAKSTSFDIVGYSLPMTDLVANAMITESFRAAQADRMLKKAHGDPQIVVANPCPNPVITSLTAAGVDDTRISTLASIDEYADRLERDLAAEARPGLITDLRSVELVYVRARDGKRFGVREVTHVDGKLRLTMNPEPLPIGAELLHALQPAPDIRIEVSRKGQHAPVIGQEHDEDGALVLTPSWLDSHDRH